MLIKGQAPWRGADPRVQEEYQEGAWGASGRNWAEVGFGYAGKWERQQPPEGRDPVMTG